MAAFKFGSAVASEEAHTGAGTDSRSLPGHPSHSLSDASRLSLSQEGGGSPKICEEPLCAR